MPASRLISKIVDTKSTLAAGESYLVKLSKLPKAIEGRPVHVKALVLRGTVQYDASAAATVYGYLAAACFADIQLKGAGHRFIAGLDGTDINKLASLRAGADQATEPSDAVHAMAASDQTLSVEVVIPIANMFGPEGAKHDGAIPAALLNENSSDSGLEFTCASTFDGLANVTIDNITSIEVDAILEPLDHLRVPTPWRMRKVTEAEEDFTVALDGRAIACVVYDRKQEDGTYEDAPTHQGYSQLQLVKNDVVVFSNRAMDDMARFYNFQVPLGGTTLSTSTPEVLPLSLPQPGTKRSKMDSGRIRLECGTRQDATQATLTKSRLLIWETGRSSHSQMHKFLLALGAPAESANPSRAATFLRARFANKDGRSAGHPIADVLDRAAYWPGMSRKGYSIPEKKLRNNFKRI